MAILDEKGNIVANNTSEESLGADGQLSMIVDGRPTWTDNPATDMQLGRIRIVEIAPDDFDIRTDTV